MEEVNSSGGKQSAIQGLPTLVPARAMACVYATLKRGSHYGIGNWRDIPPYAKVDVDFNNIKVGHLDHAMMHINNFLRDENGSEESAIEELSHTAVRALMALETYIDNEAGPLEMNAFLENESGVKEETKKEK